MAAKKRIVLLNRPEKHFLGSFYFQKIKYGIDAAIENSGYDLGMALQDSAFIESLSKEEINTTGVLNIAPHIVHPSIKLLEKKKISSFLINCRSEHLNWIDVDNKHGVKTMAEHLISLGHKKILFINGFSESQNSIDRLNGFKETLEDNNIKFDPKLVVNCDFSITLTYERIRSLLNRKNKPEFSAIFATNDLMAIGAIRALTDYGISVPHGVAVVGFDDFDFSSTFQIPLTTYKQPFNNIGFLATKYLMKEMEGKSKQSEHIELIGELVIRKSCGCKME